MRSVGWALVQYDGVIGSGKQLVNTETQGENQVRTEAEAGVMCCNPGSMLPPPGN